MNVNALIEKIERLSTRQVASILALVGILAFLQTFWNGFVGDDMSQIVHNPVVHSLKNILLYFQGGTFYVGDGIAPLYGAYYRPFMTTVLGVLYAVFGAHALFFHAVQLMFHIGSAVLFYAILRLSVRQSIAFFCTLLFLVHPINSQSVYAIASMQDATMLFFGLLGLWLLMQHTGSRKSLVGVGACLFIALLSKESAIVFALMYGYFAWQWQREHFKTLSTSFACVIAVWAVMRVAAVGLLHNPGNAPILHASFGERLLTVPSALYFYAVQFVAPIKISAMYYWTHASFSMAGVGLPLVMVILCVSAMVFAGRYLQRKAPKRLYYTYLFYAAWFFIHVMLISQVFHALDMTACITWFYAPSVGLIGMLAIVLSYGLPKLADTTWLKQAGSSLFVVCMVVLCVFSVRTFVRGGDWRTEIRLATHDIQMSQNAQDNFNFAHTIALDLTEKQDYAEAQAYAERSVQGFEMAKNTYLLGKIYYLQRNFSGAYASFQAAEAHEVTPALYEYMALCLLHTGDASANRAFYRRATSAYARSANIWQIWAVYEYTKGNPAEAPRLITKARAIDPQNTQIQSTYTTITTNSPLTVD